jgi:hypothetical protein
VLNACLVTNQKGEVKMSEIMNAITGIPNISDGTSKYQPRVTREGATVINQLHGEYAEQLRRGKIFIATVGVAGIALITSATTGGHPTIWNPAGSGVILSFISLSLNSMENGSQAPTGLGWYITTSAGAAAATGAAILTWTNVAPVNALAGFGGTSAALWAPATNTFTAAPAFYLGADFSMATLGSANTATSPWANIAQYDGKIGLYPGTALSLCSVNATTTNKFIPCLIFEELPL